MEAQHTDINNVQDKNMEDQEIASIYLNIKKTTLKKAVKIIDYILLVVAVIFLVTFFAHLAFPDIEWLWNRS